MKRYGYLITVMGLAISLSGCMNPQGQTDYTGSGILTGAATGAVFGSAATHSPEGAIAGAALGAMTGAVIGSGIDEQNSQQNAAMQSVPIAPLTLDEIKDLVKAGISEDVIISQIRASGAAYYLTSNDIIDLKDGGVSEKVIDYIINTPNTSGSAASSRTVQQVYTPDPVIITTYPRYVWIGGSWLWYDGYSPSHFRPHPGMPGPGGHMR